MAPCYVLCAGAGRTLPDGTGSGLFDLDDPTFEPKVDAATNDLEIRLASYVSDDGFTAPCYSDVIGAKA